MKNLNNERGVALVTSLLLTLIALAIIMALLYLVTWQTQLSAAHRRYKNALEASQGGVEIFTKQVIPYIFTNNSTGSATVPNLRDQFASIHLTAGSNACLKQKLNVATAQWGAACSAGSSSSDPKQSPDTTFKLQGVASQDFMVFAKIVDTVPGNSDTSGYALLDSGLGVAGTSPGVTPKHMPALYRIEVQGEKEFNPQEKSRLSVLYAF